MTLSIERINKARKAGYKDEDIIESISQRDPEFGSRIQKARELGHDNSAILQSIEKRLNTPVNTPTQRPNTPVNSSPEKPDNSNVKPLYMEKPESKGLGHAFASGLKESASGEVARQVFNDKSKEEIAQDPSFWEKLVHSAGTITGDTPYILAGTTLGGALGSTLGSVAGPVGTATGGLAGGAFGALAMPAFIKEALKEYRDYQDKGNDITFGEFLTRADRVASKTLKEGAFGVILGSINKAMPLLEKIPGVGTLFSSKIAQKGAAIATETAAAATIPPVTEGRLPTGKDFAQAAALVLGFNALKLPKAIRDKIQKAGEASGKTPEEFAKTPELEEIVSTIDKTKLNQEKINIEPARNEIEKREPEKVNKTTKEIASDLDQVTKSVEEMPKSNKRNLAKEAIKRGHVRTPEQLNLFLDEYESTYEGIPGRTGLSKNRKFMNKYAEKNVENRQIEQVEGETLVEVTPSLERQLQMARIKKREAKFEGNKSKLKETQKKIDLSKRKLKNQTDQKTEAPKENVKPEDVKPLYNEETLQAKLTLKPKELSVSNTKEIKPTEPIIETTGEGAEKRIEYIQDSLNKNVDRMNSVIEAVKNPKESLSRLGHAANTAIFNFMAPLEKAESNIPVPQRASTRIKLAQSSASEINSVLENGIFSNVTGQFEHEGLKGAYGDVTWKRLNKGLKPEEYSIQDLDTYRASRVALRRQKEGKKTGIDTAQAQKDVKRLHQKYGPIDQRIREYNKKVLEVYGKDLIGKDKIDEWSKQYYAPLFRVMEAGNNPILRPGSLQPKQPFKKFKGSERKIIAPSESDPYNTSMLISNAKKNEAVLQYKKLVEQGQLPGKIRKSKNEPLPPELIEDLELEGGLEQVAESLYNQTRKDSYTPRKNILRGWKDGKPFEIEVPDDIYDVFSTFAPQDRSNIAQFFATSNRLFSRGISLSPRRAISIGLRDALSSLVFSRTGSNPLSVTEALGDIYKDNKVYKEFLALGGDVYAARLAGRIDRAKKIEEFVTPGREGKMFSLDKIGDFFDWYTKQTSNASMAVPLAEYKRALSKYGESAEGRLMAAMEARSVTYDPTRKGGSKIIQELNNYIPFWNVSLQELSMLGKSLKNPSTYAKGISTITVPTLMLKMLNDDNPRYQELTPQDKAAYWHIFMGDKHARIAIPWLLGTTFKVGPEFFFDIAKQRGGEAWTGLWNNFLDNLSGDIPPIFQSYVEWQTNKSLPSPISSLFGGESNAPEVVPKRLQGLPNKYQYTSKTSQLARWFGDLWGISPIKLERAIKSNTGTLGAEGLALIDEIAYFTGLAEDKRPAQRESNYLLLGHFLTSSPTNRTKYANEFYQYLEKSRLANAGEKKGESNENKKKYSHLGSYNSKISKMFREYREIEDSNIDAKLKKRRLDAKQIEINNLYKEAVEKIKK